MDMFSALLARSGASGGASGEVDQIYDPQSANAQSGTAVKEAVKAQTPPSKNVDEWEPNTLYYVRMADFPDGLYWNVPHLRPGMPPIPNELSWFTLAYRFYAIVECVPGERREFDFLTFNDTGSFRKGLLFVDGNWEAERYDEYVLGQVAIDINTWPEFDRITDIALPTKKQIANWVNKSLQNKLNYPQDDFGHLGDIAVSDGKGGVLWQGRNDWYQIQTLVKQGLGEQLFPVGYEFETYDADTERNLTWVVKGHDHYKAADKSLTHTMALETKDVYSGANGTYIPFQFSARQAFYYAKDGLQVGTYSFTVENQAWFPDDNGKDFNFTLTSPVPQGGQLVFDMTYNQTLEGKNVETYGAIGDTQLIEKVVISEGRTGTFLGKTDGTGNMNHMHRAIFGSNNYDQSALRQWCNSGADKGGVWKAKTVFDRPPSWNTAQNGFMHGLPKDFLDVVQEAEIDCRTNNVYEVDSLDGTAFNTQSLYTTKDKFFLLSRPEIYGTWDDVNLKDGTQLELYKSLTIDEERKRYDASGVVRYVWLRSPYPTYASFERVVSVSGAWSSSYASNSVGVSPACIIG